MRRFKITLLFGLLASIGPAVLATDDATPDRKPVGGLSFLDEVEITVVNIDVFVRDKNGQPVTDLTIDDFKVSQDGQERKLTNFILVDEAVRRSVMAQRDGAAPGQPEAGEEVVETQIRPVHIVVYIDNENIFPFDRNRVLGHLRTFLAETVGPGVEAMIVSNQGSPQIIQTFTSNMDELSAALRELRRGTGGLTQRQSEYSRLRRDIQRLQNEGENRQSQSQKVSLVFEDLISYAEQVSAEVVRDITAIRMLGAGFTGLPGRKCFVHVSSGLPMVAAKDLFFQFFNFFQDRNMLAYTSRYNQRAYYADLAAAANSQGMVFYTIDAKGSTPGSSISAETGVAADPSADAISQMNLQEPLVFLAERTGGIATVGTNNFAAGFERIREDILTYYSIGYSISSAGGDRVHRIEVEIPGRPDLDVRYRRTFVEKSRESKVQDRVMTALLFDIDENPMGIDTVFDKSAPAQEGRYLLPLRVSFPARSIALLPEGENLAGEVVLFVSLRDDAGKQADLQSREQPISIPSAEYERISQLPLSIDLQLLVEPGRYRVAVGLYDRLTRQASYQVLSTSVAQE